MDQIRSLPLTSEQFYLTYTRTLPQVAAVDPVKKPEIAVEPVKKPETADRLLPPSKFSRTHT
jgi:hypothetical protein